MAGIPVALQLYTVRDDFSKDFESTLRQVAEIGYTGVEFAGFNGLPAKKIHRVLRELNLRVVGAHVPLEQLEEDLESVVEYNLELGNDILVVASVPEEKRRDKKKWRSLAGTLNEIAKDVEDYGLKICYHNHAFEFDDLGGQTGFQILLEELEPDAVGAEIDTYWVKYGGADPAELIRQWAGRCPLLHIKDMGGDEQRSCTEVGGGILDWDAIFQAAEQSGVQWYIVEQDTCARPALESARMSFENLKARGQVGEPPKEGEE